MIVRHERSGGYAGITVNVEVDSETLPAKHANELKGLVEKAFPSDQPLKKQATMPDQFNYEFIIEDGDKTKTYQVNDQTITDEMRDLSKWLIATAQKRESRIVPCNWKVTAEAFLEVYHFRHIHSHGGVSILDNRGAAMGLYPNGHSRMITPFSEQRAAQMGMSGWDDWRLHDHGPFPTIANVSPMVDCTSTAVSLFPNVIIPLGRIGFPINIFWPVDEHTTRLEWRYYAPPPAGSDRFADELPDHWIERRRQYNAIMAEDEMNMAPIQRSMESPALRGIPINYQERRIWHLHEQIDRVIGVQRIPPEMRVEPLLEAYVEPNSQQGSNTH